MLEAQKGFKLHSEYKPTGDQPQAIEALVQGFQEGNQFQTLLGVTGSGKTFTMANVIAQLNKPTLIISHNKTLAAKLYGEFKECSGWTNIFIYPGIKLESIDGLITNFHLPKSTLIMLVSAFSSKDKVLNAYKIAVNNKYRFFSFGDCMFIK